MPKKTFFQKVVPRFIREPIEKRRKRKNILEYYQKLERPLNEEEKSIINYLKNNKLSTFPYPFQDNYKKKSIQVFDDKNTQLKYVLLDNKKLYFRRKSSSRGIRRNCNNLLLEQDINSPHRYLTDNFTINNNDVLVDIGAAEGNLALSVIEKVKKAYLFETNPDWIEALEATFAPWKKKVEIINKFVSNKDDDKHVSLDRFFKNKGEINFIKIDAEGAESDILEGGDALFTSNAPLKVAICTYHSINDDQKFNGHFKQRNFITEFSDGYMIFNDQSVSASEPPFLRKGLIRAVR